VVSVHGIEAAGKVKVGRSREMFEEMKSGIFSHCYFPFSLFTFLSTNMAIHKELTILNKLGIHARPAAQFVKIANRFSCNVRVEKDSEEVDGKSIMGLMMLAAGNGSIIEVTTEGSDEVQCMEALSELVARKFEEE
jgi:phosphocarrier protein